MAGNNLIVHGFAQNCDHIRGKITLNHIIQRVLFKDCGVSEGNKGFVEERINQGQ